MLTVHLITQITVLKKQNEKWYDIEKIVAYKKKHNNDMFRVRWKGLNAAKDTWEPAENVTEYAKKQYFKKYNKQGKLRKRPLQDTDSESE